MTNCDEYLVSHHITGCPGARLIRWGVFRHDNIPGHCLFECTSGATGGRAVYGFGPATRAHVKVLGNLDSEGSLKLMSWKTEPGIVWYFQRNICYRKVGACDAFLENQGYARYVRVDMADLDRFHSRSPVIHCEERHSGLLG